MDPMINKCQRRDIFTDRSSDIVSIMCRSREKSRDKKQDQARVVRETTGAKQH